MDGVIEKAKYLDFNGLKKYDELIKSYIELGNKSLANASDVSALLIDVAALKAIDHDAYISADVELENTLKGYIDTKMDSKQDVIADLDTIRANAALGATALQEVPAEYVTETELEGKGYSTEGYVDEKVAALVNGAPETLDTLDELAAALKDNADIVDVLTNSIGAKQNVIDDLDTIRANAAKGATALQEVPAEYVTETELEGKGYATTTQVNAKQDAIADLADIRANAAKGATALQEVPAEYVTETELEGKGYLTESDLVFATNDDVDGLFA